MEFINVNKFEGSQESQVVKRVPILTDQLMATLLLIEPQTTVPSHLHQDQDEILYIIEGAGKISIGKTTQIIEEGMLILVPRNVPHNFSTSKDKLLVASICQVANHPANQNIKKTKGVTK
jgi:quercetin dioxygenase-like cupin family protein